ncbi:MAG: phosphoribosylaminoimidazolesuccinocarboxamide synthase [Chloroflexi bacterium]|nr:phosphoribosylaminoimidazolesuccinocarboxamide synthase [Chloroflexota bacterium]
MSTVFLETHLPHPFYRGKVRDLYHLGDDLLMVATDRISAFDFVLPAGIPDKGVVLNLLSAFWFQKTAHIVGNHMLEVVEDVRLLDSYVDPSACYRYPPYLARRSMVVRRAERIPVECVVRGYLAGSAWVEYQERETIGGEAMPAGLRESDPLPQPLFTPTTKADSGHDESITLKDMEELVGRKVAQELEELSLAVYRYAEDYARGRGIIIADTKMEFGFIDGQICLIDELLTPDSSRFWDMTTYRPGEPQPSFDKQYLRDWLVASGWNKEPPAPPLPPEVVAKTAEKYREAYRRLSGEDIEI